MPKPEIPSKIEEISYAKYWNALPLGVAGERQWKNRKDNTWMVCNSLLKPLFNFQISSSKSNILHQKALFPISQKPKNNKIFWFKRGYQPQQPALLQSITYRLQYDDG